MSWVALGLATLVALVVGLLVGLPIGFSAGVKGVVMSMDKVFSRDEIRLWQDATHGKRRACIVEREGP